MPQIVRPAHSKVKVVPRDGQLEITLNINISIDGKVTATSEEAEVLSVPKDEVEPAIPDFVSGFKLKFGKEKE